MANVTFLHPFGVELSATQITTIGDDRADAIIDLLARHRVVVFRDQCVSDAEFVDFLGALGPLMFTPGETPVPGAPHLNIVSNVGRATPPRSVFHTDTSYVERPPAYGAMRAVTLPDVGGETLFSDQVYAAAALPHHVRSWLASRTLLHKTTSRDGSTSQARHPVLQRHPLSNEATLFLSTPERCCDLSDVEPAESERVVRLLYRRSTRAAHVYRHRWRSGDIVLWDNRATMHRADHAGVVGDRVLHRGLVQGPTPQNHA